MSEKRSKLYAVLRELMKDGKLSTMESVAIAAACELAVRAEYEAPIGTKVHPVLRKLMEE